ncbi:hypothetical protein NY78_1823 [Desulfovibrio sp. TomC]|nr:hypothetical protein NY78_1823 [Desulfovibrio sp. TomC]
MFASPGVTFLDRGAFPILLVHAASLARCFSGWCDRSWRRAPDGPGSLSQVRSRVSKPHAIPAIWATAAA